MNKEPLTGEYQYISHCGMYYCVLCPYHLGSIVKAAQNLSAFVETVGSLEIMIRTSDVCNYDEFKKGLTWLASQNEPCRGCRFGGGWSWS